MCRKTGVCVHVCVCMCVCGHLGEGERMVVCIVQNGFSFSSSSTLPCISSCG